MVIRRLASTWLRGRVTACSETNELCIVQSYYVRLRAPSQESDLTPWLMDLQSTIVRQTSTSENECLQPSPKVCQIKDSGPQALESQEDNARCSGMPPLPASTGDITNEEAQRHNKQSKRRLKKRHSDESSPFIGLAPLTSRGITSEKDNTDKCRTDRGRDESEADLRHKNDTGEAPVTIDEPSSRAQRPLPKRTTTMPEPNPARSERIKKLSDSILAIIPYLAGPRWEAKYQSKAIPMLKLFLKGIDFPEKGEINLTMSIPKSNQARRDFGGPWVIILDGISAAFRAWLLDLGLISLMEPGATFFVESFADNKMSWGS
ncbi:hypothetical protein C8R41DRAFT_872265 [Lentinula lateritia]|uniref:Uncharacterized protein n=1 Tax=Lentinula lateritia TaxID=40482 RepID=A0ABQ8UZ69_9AGAR|nr:hypothetical protein C8R41DRAFT_872265 [Lentinula lateritia]